jgi:hypothetical protein
VSGPTLNPQCQFPRRDFGVKIKRKKKEKKRKYRNKEKEKKN